MDDPTAAAAAAFPFALPTPAATPAVPSRAPSAAASSASASAAASAGAVSVDVDDAHACATAGAHAAGSLDDGAEPLAPPSLPLLSSTAAAAPVPADAPATAVSRSGTGVLVLPGAPNPHGLPTATALVVAYRISSGGYAKAKPAYVTKESCLVNFCIAATAFVRAFPDLPIVWLLIQDACTPALADFASSTVRHLLQGVAPSAVVQEHTTAFGNGALSFNFALDCLRDGGAAPGPGGATPGPGGGVVPCGAARSTTAVYLVEDDYVHSEAHALEVVLGGLALAPYASGYDHPDKYVDARAGGNPLVEGGGEVTRVYRGSRSHYKGSNSTTLTFATTLAVLDADDAVLRMFTASAPPDDFGLFLALGATRARLLVTALPAVATHGETAFLAPFVPWGKYGKKALALVEDMRAAPASGATAATAAAGGGATAAAGGGATAATAAAGGGAPATAKTMTSSAPATATAKTVTDVAPTTATSSATVVKPRKAGRKGR